MYQNTSLICLWGLDTGQKSCHKEVRSCGSENHEHKLVTAADLKQGLYPQMVCLSVCLSVYSTYQQSIIYQ